MLGILSLRLRLTIMGMLIGSLMIAGSAQAAQSCDAIQQKQGSAAGLKCRQAEQETEITAQIASYKLTIDKRRAEIKACDDALVNDENYRWKDADLRMEREISMVQLIISQLSGDKNQAEEYQRLQGNLKILTRIRQLTSTAHTQRLKRISLRRDSENNELDIAMTEYELQLRQQIMPQKVQW
ncbi:MAG: hypothetical protein WCG83_00145 [Candidatus Peregrinibacteria bacterium]